MENSPHDLYWLAQNCKKEGLLPRLFQCCGTEDALYPMNVEMREKLLAAGIAPTWQDGPGDHNWAYWDENIQRVLAWLPLEKPEAK